MAACADSGCWSSSPPWTRRSAPRRVARTLFGVPVSGYEIHVGITRGPALAHSALDFDENADGALSVEGQILATYVHGLFDGPYSCAAMLAWAGMQQPLALDYRALGEASIERLADAIAGHFDLGLVRTNAAPDRPCDAPGGGDLINGHVQIAMLHLVPRLGGLEHSRRMVERAVGVASDLGADWGITPELCLSGCQFERRMGVDWIVARPDAWMVRVYQLVGRLRLTVFISHADRDPLTDILHNSVFVGGPDGGLLGTHRKMPRRGPAPDTGSRPCSCRHCTWGFFCALAHTLPGSPSLYELRARRFSSRLPHGRRNLTGLGRCGRRGRRDGAAVARLQPAQDRTIRCGSMTRRAWW